MSNHRAETFTSSDELKGMIKAFLFDKVDPDRCLNVIYIGEHTIHQTQHFVIQYCYEQTDNESKMADYPISFEKSDTCYEIKERVQKAIREIEEAEYNDLTSKDY
jgi:hypothetical protein